MTVGVKLKRLFEINKQDDREAVIFAAGVGVPWIIAQRLYKLVCNKALVEFVD